MITIHDQFDQGSQEWLNARCGLLTASEMKLILTPTLKRAENDKQKTHLYELLAQRINRYVEPHYIGDDMLRGHDDEVEAKILYAERFAPVEEVGFITNSKWGFTLGFSPDGLVGKDGFIECKSRRQKYQTQTILNGVMPDDYMLQVQTAFLVSERKWCDFVSYCGGMPMFVCRVYPDDKVQTAIIDAASAFEYRINEMMNLYSDRLADPMQRLIPTQRKVELEMFA